MKFNLTKFKIKIDLLFIIFYGIYFNLDNSLQ
jgi:hypothetical protein